MQAMHKVSLFMGLVLICGLCYGQDEKRSGIFLTIRCTRDIPRYDVVLSSRSVCLTAHPILTSSEFVEVTGLKVTGNKAYFDLILSSKANQTLKQLAVNLPNSGVGIVVNDRIISVFNSSEIKMGGNIRFIGNNQYRDALILAHQSLEVHIGSLKGQ